jgi:hypothetical protein
MSTYAVGAMGGGVNAWPPASNGADPSAQFANNLLNLRRQDPDQLKTVLSDIADRLNTAADSATGKQAQVLHDLAQKYEAAAKTGDLSQLNLLPPGLWSRRLSVGQSGE